LVEVAEMTEAEEKNFTDNELTANEREAIAHALLSNSPWTHKNFDNPIKANLEAAKNKIKAYHLEKANFKCCYCRRSLQDANIETDREHIVPKAVFKSLTYNIFNLSVSCKRCNMQYKKERVDHIVDHTTIETDLRNPDRYLIPHPNIDNYVDHLVRTSLQHDDGEITTYRLITEKGRFLYNFVRLDRLCVNEIDAAQGGEKVNEIIAEIFKLPIEGA